MLLATFFVEFIIVRCLIFDYKPEAESSTKGEQESTVFVGPRWPSFFEAPDFHVNIAANDVSGLKQAENDVNDELSKVDSSALHTLGDTAKNVFTGAAEWTERATEDPTRDLFGTVANAAWVTTKVAAIIAPGLVWGPAINMLGFVPSVGGGTLAATVQARIGNVAAGSIFSWLQSAGAGGAAASALNLLTRGAVVASEAVKWSMKSESHVTDNETEKTSETQMAKSVDAAV